MMRQDLGLNDDSELLPADWFGDHVERPLLPGDLSQFAANRGVQETDLKAFHPFRFDSKVNAGGGLIYFDETIERDTLKTILGVMGVHYEMMDYAIFAACSANPAGDEYLAQMRLVSHHAIECGFFIHKKLPLQPGRPSKFWPASPRANARNGIAHRCSAHAAAMATARRRRSALASWSRTPNGGSTGSGVDPGSS